VSSNVILMVNGALGTTPKSLEKNLKRAGTAVSMKLRQKAALLGTARILRKVLHRESKKGATLTMAITLSILDRFAKFFHCCKEQ